MEERWMFRFTRHRFPKGGKITTVGASKEHLLKELQEPQSDKQFLRSELISLHRFVDEVDTALEYTQEFLDNARDDDEKAWGWLKQGQIMEQMYDFKSAVEFYSKILDLKHPGKPVSYWAHNNAGYSLNQLSRFAEGEDFCRKAIQIDPDKYNAHKNLGCSLEGQARYAEAVSEYIEAVRCDASDPRAFKHLEDLVLRHKELYQQIGDLEHQLKKCREAILYVRCVNEQQG